MSLQGPVSNAAHGGSIHPWLSIGVGGLVMATLWIRYFKIPKKSEVSTGALLGITAICLVFIATGVWELFR